jgi:hypothetical protein
MATDADAIQHLDFTPTYECECNICPYHTICTGEAIASVTVHDFGSCKEPEHGDRGGPTELLCESCAPARISKAAQLVQASLDLAARSGAFIYCQSCGRGVRAMSDVIETRPL